MSKLKTTGTIERKLGNMVKYLKSNLFCISGTKDCFMLQECHLDSQNPYNSSLYLTFQKEHEAKTLIGYRASIQAGLSLEKILNDLDFKLLHRDKNFNNFSEKNKI